ncbi:uncharacterized protein [Anabrus simplex]
MEKEEPLKLESEEDEGGPAEKVPQNVSTRGRTILEENPQPGESLASTPAFVKIEPEYLLASSSPLTDEAEFKQDISVDHDIDSQLCIEQICEPKLSEQGSGDPDESSMPRFTVTNSKKGCDLDTKGCQKSA